jgi:hypothetical protein
MAANTIPITPKTPFAGLATLYNGDATYNGTSAYAQTLVTAGVDGARLDRIKIKSLGTNVATKLMLYLNNGSTPATATNNTLWAEVALAATTASTTAALPDIEIALSMPIPAGYKLMAQLTTTVALGYSVTLLGGHY